METVILEALLGKVIRRITVEDDTNDGDVITFRCAYDEVIITMQHFQDCCEDVHIEDIEGDLDDLLHTPITMAEEVTNEGQCENGHESFTWTFYKIGTKKGSVTIRWFGRSNGYYSERVEVSEHKRV